MITAERLEVLALATGGRFADGAALPEVVSHVWDAGAVPIVPWAFGKWWGEGGAALLAFLDTIAPRDLFLGDNGGRPRVWPPPAPFRHAIRRGMFVLPGSDPLPLAAGATRAGSYGFRCHGPFDPSAPAASLRGVLPDPGFTPEPYGGRETWAGFLRNQLFLRFGPRAG